MVVDGLTLGVDAFPLLDGTGADAFARTNYYEGQFSYNLYFRRLGPNVPIHNMDELIAKGGKLLKPQIAKSYSEFRSLQTNADFIARRDTQESMAGSDAGPDEEIPAGCDRLPVPFAPPPKHLEQQAEADNSFSSVSGMPAVVMPAGYTKDLNGPIAIEFLGMPFSEPTLFKLATHSSRARSCASCRRQRRRCQAKFSRTEPTNLPCDGELYVREIEGLSAWLRFGASVAALILSCAQAAFAAPGAFKVEESTIDELHAAIKDGRTTCREVVQAYVDRARAYNGVCTALVTSDGAPIPAVKGQIRAGAPLKFPTQTRAASSYLPGLDQYAGLPLDFGRMEVTASDPSVKQEYGMVVGIPGVRQVNALESINLRGERSVSCKAACDAAPSTGKLPKSCPAACDAFRQQPDALERAAGARCTVRPQSRSCEAADVLPHDCREGLVRREGQCAPLAATM
ncbi:MAG: hypothetical protein WDO56_20800 [Gammaproteobacteria bacterium]